MMSQRIKHFILVNFYFGLTTWFLASLLAPDALGRWDIMSLSAWLWVGTVMAFRAYQLHNGELSD